MTYEKKYRIARAGLDHLERAFVEMCKAHEEYRKTCHSNINFALAKVNQLKKERDNFEAEAHEWYKRAWAERNKTWWQKLKETIKSKYT